MMRTINFAASVQPVQPDLAAGTGAGHAGSPLKTRKQRKGRKHKMPELENDEAEVAVTSPKTQRTFFNLDTFENVLLVKSFDLPVKPATVQEALELVENNEAALLDLIHSGLCANVRSAAYENTVGWYNCDENKEATEPFTGTLASDEVSKLIDLAVISNAKLMSGGEFKSLDPAVKKTLKDDARAFIKSNPKIVDSIKRQAAAIVAKK